MVDKVPVRVNYNAGVPDGLAEYQTGEVIDPTYLPVIPPITTEVTKTVAADGDPAGVQDFDSFELVIAWLEKQSTSEKGRITISLEDGFHIIEDKYTIDGDPPREISCAADFISTSGIAANCTITCELNSTVQHIFFWNLNGNDFYIRNITFDPRANGSTTVNGYLMGANASRGAGAYVYCENSVFNYVNGAGSASYSSSTTVLDNCSISNSSDSAVSAYRNGIIIFEGTNVIDNCYRGIYAADKANIVVSGSLTISNSTNMGIRLWEGSTLTTSTFNGSLTLTGNFEDARFPINEIQEDGCYISDGTGLIYDENWKVESNTYTSINGDNLIGDTTSTAFTITLPATPSVGDQVRIKSTVASTNNLTIGRNGSNIISLASDYVINTDYADITFVYVNATIGWIK